MVIFLLLVVSSSWGCDARSPQFFDVYCPWEHERTAMGGVHPLGLDPTRFVLKYPATYGLNGLEVNYFDDRDCVELHDKSRGSLYCDLYRLNRGTPDFPMAFSLCKGGVYRTAYVSICDSAPLVSTITFFNPCVGAKPRCAILDSSLRVDCDNFMRWARTCFSPGREEMKVTRESNLHGCSDKIFFLRGCLQYAQLNEVVVRWGVRTKSGDEDELGRHTFSFVF